MLTHQQAPLYPVRWDHLCPAVLFPIALLQSREINGPELDTQRITTCRHPCLSKMPTQQVHTGRLLVFAWSYLSWARYSLENNTWEG